jgi:hypothetical protein
MERIVGERQDKSCVKNKQKLMREMEDEWVKGTLERERERVLRLTSRLPF